MGPTFWNPVSIRVRRLNRAETAWDPDFHTAVNIKDRAEDLIYRAQVNFGDKLVNRRRRSEFGDRPEARAHVVMRRKDLAPTTALPMPQPGDRLVAVYAGTDYEAVVDLLIEEVRLESPLRGVPLLVFCYLEADREREATV